MIAVGLGLGMFLKVKYFKRVIGAWLLLLRWDRGLRSMGRRALDTYLR